MTVREQIFAVAHDLRDNQVPPSTVREHLMTLTGLLSNVMAECRSADMEFNSLLLECYRTEETANRAKLTADASPQYARKREAKDTHTLCVEMMRACKAILRSLDTEVQLAR
jgi:hypothetical protein